MNGGQSFWITVNHWITQVKLGYLNQQSSGWVLLEIPLFKNLLENNYSTYLLQ